MNCVVCAALVGSVALVGCGGSATPAPAPQAQATASAEPKNEALARADALVADLKKREAAFQAVEKGGKTAASESTPVVVEASRPGKAVPTTGPFPTTTSPVPPPSGPRRSSVDVITSSYQLAEKNKTLWTFSWTMSVRNQERTPIRVRAEMDFRDFQGALLGAADKTIDIAGSTVAEVRGVVVMKASDAALVARATPRIALLKSP